MPAVAVTKLGAVMLRTAVAVTAGALLFAPPTVSAQANQWTRVVKAQIREHSSFLTDRGYELATDVYQGSLHERESEYLEATLHAGTQYAFLGVCDQDCTDIDLRLFDPDGDETDNDIGTDDWPVVKVTPQVTGKYKIKVIMVACKTSPCFYGVGEFTK